MSNGTQPTHTSKEERQHPRGMQTHKYRHTRSVLFPSHTLKAPHSQIYVHGTRLLFHIHAHTQPVKFQLSNTFNVLALSPLFPSFLFSHLLCLFICTLFLFCSFIRISPFSQAGLRALLLLNHYQTAQWLFRGALSGWCNRDTTKKALCYPRWAEVRSLRRTDLKHVTLRQQWKVWICETIKWVTHDSPHVCRDVGVWHQAVSMVLHKSIELKKWAASGSHPKCQGEGEWWCPWHPECFCLCYLHS